MNSNIKKERKFLITDIREPIVIQTTGYLLSIAETLKQKFEKFNCEVRIMDANRIIEDIQNNVLYTKSTKYIFLFIWHVNIIIPSYITYFIYNLEQIHRYTNFPAINIENNIINQLFKNSKGIFDYSLTNISMYDKLNIKKPIYFPIPISNNLLNNTKFKKKYDILFFGSLTERRNKILFELQRQIPLKIIIIGGNKKVYGEELYDIIKSSNIILNIHAEENSLLETGRIHDCLAINHNKIISELPMDIDIKTIKNYEMLVHFCPVIKKDLSNIDVFIKVIKEVYFNKVNIISPSIELIKNKNEKYLYFIIKEDILSTNSYIANFENFYDSIDINNRKIIHRHNCFKNIKSSRNLQITEFGTDKTKETVLIEFRKYPHIEFLLRNTIFKLSSEWNHTVVCGIENYELVNNICKSISSKIKIIKLEISKITPSEYSQLLLTREFWDNFEGEKLLIYQEDTLLFHGDIDKFLEYDYVGAPWPLSQDDNLHGVGNGGFSLRSKSKMIECINTVKVEDLVLGKSTQKYMKNTNSTFVPEDVYFSKTLIDYKLGKVCTRDIAKSFSQETQLSVNPLGGHNFWLAENNIINKPYIIKYNLLSNFYSRTDHRSGWKSLIQNCIDSEILTTYKNEQNINIVDSMEDYFLYNISRILYEPWIGIIHFTNNLPGYLKTQEIAHVIKAASSSLNSCIGIITLSKYNQQLVKNLLPKQIPIYYIKHPIEKIDKSFNIENFLIQSNNKQPNIIQLGAQYRIVSTIYTIKASNYKIWLSGINKINSINIVRHELNYLNIPETNLNKVEIKRTDTIDEFDELLLNNIVIIPLWNASANNSVLECMEMNIPAFVTRLPSTEEYLGKNYPMFYSNISEVEEIINNKSLFQQKYKETHAYLLTIDKSDIHYEHFNSELLKIINQ